MASKRPKGRAATVPDLAAALDTLQQYLDGLKEEEIPEGFHTSKQYVEQTGKSIDVVQTLLLKGVRAGKVERRKFKAGRQKTYYYRFLGEKK